MCHGDSARVAATGKPGLETTDDHFKSAPPRSTAVPGVPATQAHLTHVYSGTVAKAIACADCHPTPATGDQSGAHRDGAISLSFSALAKAGGTNVIYSGPTSYSCSATWCHGDNFVDPGGNIKGAVTQPSWSATDGAAKLCNGCHKQPPTDPVHTTINSRSRTATSYCYDCHPQTVDSFGNVIVTGTASDKHINGDYDTTVTCTSCHGMPPTTPDERANGNDPNGVGNHVAHAVTPTIFATKYGCAQCHPDNTGNDLHANGTPDMSFTGIAAGTGWNGGTSTCGTSYCHGSGSGTAPLYKDGLPIGPTSRAQSLWGGTTGTTPPVWTDGTDVFKACTSCHGAPPTAASAGHPSNTRCDDCHPAGATPTTGVPAGITAPSALLGTHVDGHLDVLRTGCTACHGDYGSDGVAPGDLKAAPGYNVNVGRDAAGLTTGGTQIGGHNAHLQRTDLRTGLVRCDECHVVPAANDTAHANGVAAVDMAGALSTTAKVGGLTPSYSGGSCSSVYCHGAAYTARGAVYAGSNAAPSWIGGTAARACGTCHRVAPNNTVHTNANNPAAPQNCNACHGAAYDCDVNRAPLGTCQVDPALHINGVGNFPTGCSDCHGQPPATGSHVAHATTSLRAVALDCDSCHGTKPASGSITHADGVKAIGWSALATANATTATPGVTPAGFTTPVSCSNYCHAPGDAAVYGGLKRPITWDSGTVACDACHGAPPPVTTTAGVDHPQNPFCYSCHGAGYDLGGLTVGALGTHLDTTLQKPANGCTACHGVLAGVGGAAVTSAGPTVAPGYNGTGVDTTGDTLTTARGVGAHDGHVRKTNLRSAALPCDECHSGAVPVAGDTAHANGTVAQAFGALAKTGGVTPGWDGTTCSATYCHGNFKNGNGQFVMPAAPTSAPTGVIVAALGANAEHITWTAAAGANLYYVERGTSGTGPWVGVGTTAATRYVDIGLAPSTAYYYRVSAWTAGGFGPVSAMANATTAANGTAGAQRTDIAGGAAAASVGIDGMSDVITQTSYTFGTTVNQNMALGRRGTRRSRRSARSG